MELQEAIERIEEAMERAGEVARENRANGDPSDYDAGRQAGLKEALEMLGDVRCD
jgi:hypothetical protein